MKKEYKIAKGWAIFIWICAPGLIFLFGLLGIMPYTNDEFELILALVMTPISLVMILLMIITIIDSIKGKLIIEEKQLISISALKTRKLAFKDIKGISSNQNYLFFIPHSSNLKKIKVSTNTEKYNQLFHWATSNFRNLDQEEVKQDTSDILENEDYGYNIEQREHQLLKTRKKTKALNGISLAIGLVTMLFPHYYQEQIIICAILPIIGLILLKSSKGLIRLDDKPNSAHPDLHSTFFFPSSALTIRALMDYNVFNYEHFWKPALLIFSLLIVIVFFKSKARYNFKKASGYLAILAVLIFGGLYSYGLIITTNAIFDQSVTTTYNAKILDKHKSSGKTTTYYLELTPWGPQTQTEDVSVSKQVYNSQKIGDSTTIYFRSGFFQIPYYAVIDE
ncbi:hypothetical protein EMN47_15955 [Prolixibacteraceae bacterium JC049]|nr:hypothetical protein [Prolixibacteraceae bacterium JC049]